MNIINRLTSFANSFWEKCRKLPPTVQISGGLVAVVVLTKLAWPLAFAAIIAASVALAVCPDHTDPIN